jgi:hypothetical protein
MVLKDKDDFISNGYDNYSSSSSSRLDLTEAA